MSANGFLGELRRRHVFRVAAAYVVTAWLLLQLGDILFPAFGAPGWAIRLLFGFLVLGFPVALLLAWAFEMTPEGVRRTEPAHSPEAQPPLQRRRAGSTLNTITIVVLAAAVAVLGWRQFAQPSASRPTAAEPTASADANGTSSRSIAVLPFANESGDSANQYFSDGLSEDLIIALSQSPGLRVIGRESSFQFRGRDLDSKVIGSRLGVSHLLEGSVSREGVELRLRAELVNTADGSTLWSETFDRPYRNLFMLQDDLTKAVATALEARLLPGAAGVAAQTDRPPSGDLSAYNAYLEGNFYFQRLNEADWRRAIGDYGKAVRVDPRYAAAYAALSHAWTSLGGEFRSGAERWRAYDSAEAAVDTALSLDPDLAAGHESRGLLLHNEMHFHESEAELHRALELAPGSGTAQTLMAMALATEGRQEEAVDLQRKSVAADPLDASQYLTLALYLGAVGRYAEAAKVVRRGLALQPAGGWQHAALTAFWALRGDTAEALKAARAEPVSNWRTWALAVAYTSAGHRRRADAALDTLISEDADAMPSEIAAIYALRGEPDRVFTWLDRAWRQRDPEIAMLLNNPFYRRYRDDPRFAALCRTVGLPVPRERGSRAGAASSSR